MEGTKTNSSGTGDNNYTQLTQKPNKRAFFKKRRGCPLSIPGAPEIDYKNPELLSKFISEGGRMLPSRITNVCAKKQRKLKRAIKTARILGLLRFVYISK